MSLRMRVLFGTFGVLAFLSTFVCLFLYMGVFNKMYGNKSSDDSTNVPSRVVISHQEDWAAYLSTIDNDKVGSIMVDLGLKFIVPIASKPNRLRVDVPMNYPDENGLPMQREFESINEIDDRLKSTLTSKIGAVYAGHLYCQGKMSLYYYMGDNTSFETTLSEAMSAFPNYKYEYKVDREEKWESYTEFLYPLPVQMKSIQNERVVENLRREGDTLEKQRLVQHWIYFKNESDREQFLESIKGLDFQIESKHQTSIGDSPFALQISRFDRVDHTSVDRYVLDLWQKANDANGEYDGWETEVVRN